MSRRHSSADVFWAVAEVLPWGRLTSGEQETMNRLARQVLQSIRWRRALVAVPALTAILAGQAVLLAQDPGLGGSDLLTQLQSAQAERASMDAASNLFSDSAMPTTTQFATGGTAGGYPVRDTGKWLQDQVIAYQKAINDLISQNKGTADFITNSFIAYKSFKMLNSIAQRIRYGNIDFLVAMAMPKLDFTTQEDPEAGTSISRHTVISFVPTPYGTQNNIAWLMRNGSQKIRQDLTDTQAKTSTIGQQVLSAVKNALENPQGDVTYTTFTYDPNAPAGWQNATYDMSSPAIWVQLAQADATAAWIYSQHNIGIGVEFQHPDDAIAEMQNRIAASGNDQLLAAFNQVLSMQQQAAASGENIYNSQDYQHVLANYYALLNANPANYQTQIGGVAIPTSVQHMQAIQDRVAAQQEMAGGASVTLYSALNRDNALASNLQSIGRAYQSDQLPTMSLGQFMSQDPRAAMHEQMGLNIKIVTLLQAIHQDNAEILKTLAARQLQDSKTEIQNQTTKKAMLLAGTASSTTASANASQASASQAMQAQVGAANATIQKGTTTTYFAGNPTLGIPAQSVTTTNTTSPAMGASPTTATHNTSILTRFRQSVSDSQTKACGQTVSEFQNNLQDSLTNIASSRGLVGNITLAMVGAFKQFMGQNFDLQSEAQAWKSAGQTMATGIGVDPGTFTTNIDAAVLTELPPRSSDLSDPLMAQALAGPATVTASPSVPAQGTTPTAGTQ